MIDFHVGETKYVSARIAPKNPKEIMIISSARFELEMIDKAFNKKVIQTGECEIDGDVISALVTTDKIGKYKITMTVKIGKEKIIEDADIIVRG